MAQVITDVIPIHTSDTSTFKRCRRRWNWTSPTRYNLRPKVASQGINFNLTFGSCVHTVLEGYYGAKNREKFNVLDAFAREWKRIVEAVQEQNPGFYVEHEEEFVEHLDLGFGMLNHYKEWSLANDDFKVIRIEHPFSVDVGHNARDTATGELLPIHYKGRMDLVIQDLASGKYGIMDHKTSSRHEDEDYFAKLDMDEQVTRYAWAAQLEAGQQDLPYKKIDFVYYNVLFKGYPKLPTLTTRGVPSLNRQSEMTTAKLFSDMVMADDRLKQWYVTTDKAQEYYNWLKEVGTRRFLYREFLTRNDQELKSCGERIIMEIQDMLSPDLRIYPNATGEWYCIKCPFRNPCIAAMDGTDVNFMLETMYEQNMDAEGNYTNV